MFISWYRSSERKLINIEIGKKTSIGQYVFLRLLQVDEASGCSNRQVVVNSERFPNPVTTSLKFDSKNKAKESAYKAKYLLVLRYYRLQPTCIWSKMSIMVPEM